jgi:hypothetical protein
MSSYPLGGKLNAAGGVEISTLFRHIDTKSPRGKTQYKKYLPLVNRVFISIPEALRRCRHISVSKSRPI